MVDKRKRPAISHVDFLRRQGGSSRRLTRLAVRDLTFSADSLIIALYIVERLVVPMTGRASTRAAWYPVPNDFRPPTGGGFVCGTAFSCAPSSTGASVRGTGIPLSRRRGGILIGQLGGRAKCNGINFQRKNNGRVGHKGELTRQLESDSPQQLHPSVTTLSSAPKQPYLAYPC